MNHQNFRGKRGGQSKREQGWEKGGEKGGNRPKKRCCVKPNEGNGPWDCISGGGRDEREEGTSLSQCLMGMYAKVPVNNHLVAGRMGSKKDKRKRTRETQGMSAGDSRTKSCKVSL